MYILLDHVVLYVTLGDNTTIKFIALEAVDVNGGGYSTNYFLL